MKKQYPSKKAKRRAEYVERKKKRSLKRDNKKFLSETDDIERMTALLGVKLQ